MEILEIEIEEFAESDDGSVEAISEAAAACCCCCCCANPFAEAA
jgi:hypothetical protein